MKKIFYHYIGILFLTMFFISCSEDDSQDPSMSNHFKVDNLEYDLSKGILINNGPGNGFEGYYLVLFLFSEDLDFTQGENPRIFGTGDRLTFGFTPITPSLDEGAYSFKNTPPFSAGTFRLGTYAVGWGLDNDNDGNLDLTATNFDSGIVSVERDGDEYEITIDCQAVDGKSVTGYYKGRVRYIDRTLGLDAAN